MKPQIIHTGFLILFLLMTGAGCEKNKLDLLCYKGKIVNLNQQTGCQNIIEIVNTPDAGALPVGTTLSFNPDLFGNKLKIGDIIYFKVLIYEKFGDIIMPHHCFAPQYAAIIEFCGK